MEGREGGGVRARGEGEGWGGGLRPLEGKLGSGTGGIATCDHSSHQSYEDRAYLLPSGGIQTIDSVLEPFGLCRQYLIELAVEVLHIVRYGCLDYIYLLHQLPKLSMK